MRYTASWFLLFQFLSPTALFADAIGSATSCTGQWKHPDFCARVPRCHRLAVMKSKSPSVDEIWISCNLTHPLKPHEDINKIPSYCQMMITATMSANNGGEIYFFLC